jgi:hypothetical protein
MRTDNNRPELICVGCGKTPDELDEYVSAAREECSGVPDMTPDDYVWQEEGTLNRENGHFTCTDCYVRAGMPSWPRGWAAP